MQNCKTHVKNSQGIVKIGRKVNVLFNESVLILNMLVTRKVMQQIKLKCWVMVVLISKYGGELRLRQTKIW